MKQEVYSNLVHNETAVYSNLMHNETAVYSNLMHNETAVYSNLVHNETAVYSNLVHNETVVYSNLVHNETAVYSNLVHNETVVYSNMVHNETAVYSNHTHFLLEQCPSNSDQPNLTECDHLVSAEAVEDVPSTKASTTLSNSKAGENNSVPTTDSGSHLPYTPNPITNPAYANTSVQLQDHHSKPSDQYSATAPMEAVDRDHSSHQSSAYSQAQVSQSQHSELMRQEYQQNYHQQPQAAQYAPLTQASTGVSGYSQWGHASVAQSNQDQIDESSSALSHQLQRNDMRAVGTVIRYVGMCLSVVRYISGAMMMCFIWDICPKCRPYKL